MSRSSCDHANRTPRAHRSPEHGAGRLPVKLAAIVVLLLNSACGEKAAGGGAGMGMPAIPVEVAEVRAQSVRDAFEALGSLEAEESIEVVVEIDGVVRELPFHEGTQLQAGDLIAVLDDREIGANANRSAALVEQARANHRRAERLYQEKAISEQELERLVTELRVAESEEAVARARLDKTRVRAPFSGMVGRRRVSPGAYLRTGDIITELGSIDVMRVAFSAPERYAAKLKPGLLVEIRCTAYPGEIFEGRLSVVDRIIDATSRTIQLIARVANRGRKLRPGMSADVTTILASRDDALVVPDEAVFAQGNQNFVFLVAPDSSVHRIAVRLGTRAAAGVEIVSGLRDGQLVVRAGHQKIFDGARVTPILSPGSASQAAAESPEDETETASLDPE